MLSDSTARHLRRWAVSLALVVPSIIFYAVSHYGLFHDQPGIESVPTGFVKYDMAYYMAVAREHHDSGSCPLVFSNPFSASYDSPRVHFQAHLALLGFIWRLTGLDPGVIFVCCGLIASVLCMRAAIELYETVVGLDGRGRQLGLLLFCWGGGLLALAGMLVVWHRAVAPVRCSTKGPGCWTRVGAGGSSTWAGTRYTRQKRYSTQRSCARFRA